MSASHSRNDEIVATALHLAEEHGLGGVTTAALAHRLGFTEAALYRHFPCKGAIVGAALSHLAEHILRSMSLELLPTAGGQAEVEFQLRRHVARFGERHGLLMEMLVCAAAGREAAVKEAADAFIVGYTRRIEAYFAQLETRGVLPSFLPATERARLWLCQLLGGFLRSRLSGDTWDPVAQAGFHAFLESLRRTPALVSA